MTLNFENNANSQAETSQQELIAKATETVKNRGDSHLDLRTALYLGEPMDKRLRRVDIDVFISYPELAVLLNEARWLVREPRRSRARGLYIGGTNGSGKTSIAEILERDYPVAPRPLLGKEHPRVLAIGLSGARTTKAMLSRILVAAKVPHVNSYTISHYEEVVLETLRAMKCSLLITDETQDILQGHSRDQVRVIEVMKLLMNELNMPILALGTPEGKNAFRADPHMAARFETYMLPSWEVGDKFGEFLKALERSIPLKYRSDLARTEIQKILISKSGGCLDTMLKRIRLAAKHAIIDGTERITKELLEADLMHPSVSVLDGGCNG